MCISVHVCWAAVSFFWKNTMLPVVIHSVPVYLSEAEKRMHKPLNGAIRAAADRSWPTLPAPTRGWTRNASQLVCQSSLISHPLPDSNMCNDKNVSLSATRHCSPLFLLLVFRQLCLLFSHEATVLCSKTISPGCLCPLLIGRPIKAIF